MGEYGFARHLLALSRRIYQWSRPTERRQLTTSSSPMQLKIRSSSCSLPQLRRRRPRSTAPSSRRRRLRSTAALPEQHAPSCWSGACRAKSQLGTTWACPSPMRTARGDEPSTRCRTEHPSAPSSEKQLDLDPNLLKMAVAGKRQASCSPLAKEPSPDLARSYSH